MEQSTPITDTKVAYALMIKDSEPIEMLSRNIDSIAPYIDGIYITVTHNTDKVSKKAEEIAQKLKVYCLSKGYVEPEISYFKWVKDFAVARNFNWEQIPADKFQWVFWLDADDVFINGSNLRTVKLEAEKIGASAVFFNYIYRAEVEITPEGDYGIRNVLIEHLRERLVRHDGSYKWIGSIHETLIEQRATNKIDNKDCFVLHLTTEERGQEAIFRNIEILENTIEKQGKNKDPRIVYYLGKAYFDLHTEENYQKSEKLIMAYLEGSEENMRSGWSEERAQAWQYLSEIYRNRGHFNKGIKCLLNAMEEGPKFPQFYVDMALMYIHKKLPEKALHWIKIAEQMPYPRTTLVMNPRDIQARKHEVMFNYGVQTDKVDVAWAALQKLAKLFPDDQGVRDRLHATMATKMDNEAVVKIVNVANYLKDTGNEDKISDLIKAIPSNLLHYPILISLIRDFMPQKTWNKNEIAIVCGPGFEKWSPESLEKGIGGSEEAVIYNSRELAKLGWDVTVYADPEEEYTEDVDGHKITYKSHYYFNPMDKFNILIGWRNIGFFDNKWNAKKTYLWLHDVQNPLEYTKERVANITKIFVLSEAHKKTVLNDWNKEWLTDDKFLLTGNGIDMGWIEEYKDTKRDNKSVIWTSSYDRGLEHLLEIWPDVKKSVPNATLNVFYGWNLFETVHRNNPERMAWKNKVDKLLNQDGVIHHGRVGQDKIIEETYKAGIWAYPTHFYEISCITAMKCQACGAIPVVTDYAALEETARHGVKIELPHNMDIYTEEKREEYKKALIKALKDDKWQEETRKEMMKDARNKFVWSKVAKQWSGEFNG